MSWDIQNAPGYNTLLFDTPCASVSIYTNGGLLHAMISDMRVRLPITEEMFNAELTIDEQWLDQQELSGKTVEIGNTIAIDFVRGTFSERIFSGRVWDYAENIEGQNPISVNIQAKGWGDLLVGRHIGYVSTVDTITNLIKWIVQPLAGVITTNNVASSTITYSFEHYNDQITMWDAIAEICRENAWDFYVDNSKDLNAFPSSARTISETFTIGRTNVIYRTSADRLINSQRVIGSAGCVLGNDDDYTETSALSQWTSSSGNVAAVSYSRGIFGSVDPDTEHGAGSAVIREIKADASGGIWLEKAFPSGADLSMYGILSFAYKYVFDTSNKAVVFKQPLVMEIQFRTNSSNYFVTTVTLATKTRDVWVTDPDVWNTVLPYPASRVAYGWDSVRIPFNLSSKADNMTEWVRIGNPRWENINSIRFNVVSPLPSSGVSSAAQLMIDNMEISGGYYYSFRQDLASIMKYGERRGQIIYSENITSNEEAERVADYVVNTFSYPISTFESITLLNYYSLEPYLGSSCTITAGDNTAVSRIQSVEHILEGYRYSMNITLGPKYSPSVDKYLADLLKFKDISTQDRLPESVNAAALGDFLRSPLGEKDVDMSHTSDNLVRNPHFELDTDEDGIPDNWYPDALLDFVEYRTDVASKYGQYSMRAYGGLTIRSDYFPIVPSRSYYAKAWGLGELDGSNATISVSLRLCGDIPTLTEKTIIPIMSSVSPSVWTPYNRFIASTEVPPDAYWGQILVEGHSGTVGFVDNIIVQRSIGISGSELPYVRPDGWETVSTDYEFIWSETFNPRGQLVNYVVTRIGADIKSSGDDSADLKIVLYLNTIAFDTLNWSVNDAEYNRYEFSGSIMDPDGFGKTLTINYLLKGRNGYPAYARNLQAWVNPMLIKSELENPIGGTIDI